MQIAPSILSVLDQNIKNIIKEIELSNIKYLHLDVMDNIFVPNKTFNDQFIKKIRLFSNLIFDTHLMVDKPENVVEKYLEAGSDIITFHVEATTKHQIIINKIKKNNKKVGISIKPNTPIEQIIPYLEQVDLVLVMSVEPGFGGQTFQDSSIEKIKYLYDYRKTKNLNYLIEIDGGINNQTIRKVSNHVDISVVGTYFFKNDNFKETIEELTIR